MANRIPREDAALGNTLAGFLGRLRAPSYERPQGGPEEDLHVGAVGVADRLAGHFQLAEDTLFPALSASEIEDLRKDHRLLGLFARELADRLGQNDREGAYRAARSFLAVLLDHLRRENPDRNEGD
jgi:hypothetical protein